MGRTIQRAPFGAEEKGIPMTSTEACIAEALNDQVHPGTPPIREEDLIPPDNLVRADSIVEKTRGKSKEKGGKK